MNEAAALTRVTRFGKSGRIEFTKLFQGERPLEAGPFRDLVMSTTVLIDLPLAGGSYPGLVLIQRGECG